MGAVEGGVRMKKKNPVGCAIGRLFLHGHERMSCTMEGGEQAGDGIHESHEEPNNIEFNQGRFEKLNTDCCEIPMFCECQLPFH